MTNTVITCITQIVTTLLTVGATILVAYRTYRSQKEKEEATIKHLQSINCNSSLELFRAYISNLILFTSPRQINLERKTIINCIEKMKLIEQYLYELSETELPDFFVEDFRFFRLKLAFQRISIENYINHISGETILSSSFDDLETLTLITSVEKFISSYDVKKTEVP